MVPLKEAVLLPRMIDDAKSNSMRDLLRKRKEDVIAELAGVGRRVFLETTKDLILTGGAGVNELTPLFLELGIIDENSYAGALKLALMLNDDKIFAKAVEDAKEKGAGIFEIRDILWKEGFEHKMDIAYSIFAGGSLPSYDFIYKAKERYLGSEDVEGIRSAVALLLTIEKTTKILRNEYRKREYVKFYLEELKAEAEKQLEKVPMDEQGRVHGDNFAIAVYRAYFEDVYLMKQKESAYYYLRLIEKYRVRNPFITSIIQHALMDGDKRAREKALRLVRDFNLNINVESVLQSENLNERVLALQIMLKREWSEVFREMLFSEYYKERKIALEAFLKYSPKISDEEEKRIKKLARIEIGKCGVRARELAKKTAEMEMEIKTKKPEKQKLKFEIHYYTDKAKKAKETAKQVYVRTMEKVEQSLEKSRILAKIAMENSAKIMKALNVHVRGAYRNAVKYSKNIFASLNLASFNLRLGWTEKRDLLMAHVKKMKILVIAEEIKTKTNYIPIGVNWKKFLEYLLLSATVTFATQSSFHRIVREMGAPKVKLASVIQEKKEEEKREKLVSQLALKVIEGEMILSDALLLLETQHDKKELAEKLKKTEPQHQKPRPRVEMDEKTREIYVDAMGAIAITKGMDSFEYARGLLFEKYYSQNIGANKWVNILIFGDNTAWTFPTADLGKPLSEMATVNVGDILLNHVGSGYVISDHDGYLVMYHGANNGLRILKFATMEEIKKEFGRVLGREEANEFAKQKICEQLKLNPAEYNVIMKPIAFPTDYDCDRHWDNDLDCFIGNAHDFGKLRENGKRKHKGTDIYAPFKAPIYAPVDGVVVAAGWGGDKAGLRVWIQGVDGYYYMMAHLDSISVSPSQFILAGTVVGTNGESGNAKGLAPYAAHNHQEVHKGGRSNPINPDYRLYDAWFVGLEKKSEIERAVEERYLKATGLNKPYE